MKGMPVPGRREDRRVHHHDVGHREEGGDAADDVAAGGVGRAGAGGWCRRHPRDILRRRAPAVTPRRRHERLIVVGAGAAGLATAIFAAQGAPATPRPLPRRCAARGRQDPRQRRLALQRDEPRGHRARFLGRPVARGPQRAARVSGRARASRSSRTLAWRLHEEEDGKLFPDPNRSRTVLEALLDEAARLGDRRSDKRVMRVHRDASRTGSTFESDDVGSAATSLAARAVVLATGGRRCRRPAATVPGYELARRLGHGYVDTTPALAPLVLEGDRHARSPASRTPRRSRLRVDGAHRDSARRAAAVDALRRERSARAEPVAPLASGDGSMARASSVHVNVCPGETLRVAGAWWLRCRSASGRARRSATMLATRVPAAVAESWLDAAGIGSDVTMAHLAREDRRRLCARSSKPLGRSRRQPRLRLCRSHGRRRPARRDRSGDDGVARVSGPLSGRRDSRRGRPSRRLQFSVGLVVRLGGRAGASRRRCHERAGLAGWSTTRTCCRATAARSTWRAARAARALAGGAGTRRPSPSIATQTRCAS